ncbi:MAG: hypothetical protein ACKOPS_23195 [Cyanobium sp.]
MVASTSSRNVQLASSRQLCSTAKMRLLAHELIASRWQAGVDS